MDAFKPEDIPFHMIEALGVTRQMLEESGNLALLLKGERTALMLDLKTMQGNKEQRFAAHLRLVRNAGGQILFRIEAPTLQEEEPLAIAEEISLERIPFDQVKRYNITRASLSQTGDLDRLLKGEKTGIIRDVVFSLAGITKKADIRLCLVKAASFALKFKIEFVRNHSGNK